MSRRVLRIPLFQALSLVIAAVLAGGGSCTDAERSPVLRGGPRSGTNAPIGDLGVRGGKHTGTVAIRAVDRGGRLVGTALGFLSIYDPNQQTQPTSGDMGRLSTPFTQDQMAGPFMATIWRDLGSQSYEMVTLHAVDAPTVHLQFETYDQPAKLQGKLILPQARDGWVTAIGPTMDDDSRRGLIVTNTGKPEEDWGLLEVVPEQDVYLAYSTVFPGTTTVDNGTLAKVLGAQVPPGQTLDLGKTPLSLTSLPALLKPLIGGAVVFPPNVNFYSKNPPGTSSGATLTSFRVEVWDPTGRRVGRALDIPPANLTTTSNGSHRLVAGVYLPFPAGGAYQLQALAEEIDAQGNTIYRAMVAEPAPADFETSGAARYLTLPDFDAFPSIDFPGPASPLTLATGQSQRTISWQHPPAGAPTYYRLRLYQDQVPSAGGFAKRIWTLYLPSSSTSMTLPPMPALYASQDLAAGTPLTIELRAVRVAGAAPWSDMRRVDISAFTGPASSRNEAAVVITVSTK